MKTMLKVLALGVALAAFAPLASATSITGQISFGQTPNATAVVSGNQFYFVGPPVILSSNLTNIGASDSVTFSSPYTISNPITFVPNSLGNSLGETGAADAVFTLVDTTTNETIYLDVTNYSDVSSAAGTTFMGTGMLHEFGTINYDPALASFSLTVSNNGQTQFSADVVSLTPEPSSLMLLGTGLLTAVGVARRKFQA